MMAKLLLPILALLTLTAGTSQSQTMGTGGIHGVTISVDTGWQFREVGKDQWYPANVPGCVHTDLLNNKLIDDPFYRDNEKNLQWIGKTDWEYRTTFNLTAEMLQRTNLELVFEGLDTYARVFLNDELLMSADNMFRTWRVDARRLAKPGANTLRIHFRSPINEVLPIMAKMDYELPAGNDQGEKTSPHTRKAPYQYGWDWGPRFVTSGIWRPVYLKAWDNARVSDLHLVSREIRADVANLTAEVEVVAGITTAATIVIDDLTDKTIAVERRVTLTPGTNRFTLNFIIPHPALWWPNGLGAHPLYTFKARLLINGKPIDEATTRTGLRSLELKQERDGSGKSFTFVINGVPVFAKGGNWIPADSFPSRISKDKYRELVQSVRDTNMNMLRVWGGGIYERDDFYDLCDEMGILVWQDFMFGCSMYPGDQAFLENVRQEASDNVRRLRNHPSIVIWVGNNEIESGWFHWGWKEKLPAKLWDDYLKIFYGVLPEVCKSLDPSRPYWPSSPSSNLEDDPESQKMGDLHYWQVWHAAAPFTDYEKQFPRFMSEYGFQSFPQLETVSTYTAPADRDIKSPVMMAHQRHPRGNQLIREYMLREYAEPKDFESFLYVSQVLQAEGIKIGAEHLRRIRPHNMGSLFWQIDDCWPVASWSSIDYTGRWKALQYYARRFYHDVLLSPRAENGSLNFYIVSDRRESTAAQLKMSLLDFEGHTLWSQQQDIEVAAHNSKSYWAIPIQQLLAGKDPKSVFVFAELLVGGKPVSASEYFFQPYKNLLLPRPEISAEAVRTRAGFRIILSTDKLARAVYLSAPDSRGFFV
ncbi:MAG TPA: glycoside hydrolase family 2 TIM barrel-domain containing protein, partial [Pyrinomonadaceae bacterium]|nr:glycoside hydrolase family 2 TIM barrel-domain containing protein [Pyrinomonadaceae bacterium]